MVVIPHCHFCPRLLVLRRGFQLIAILIACLWFVCGPAADAATSSYAHWKNGPSTSENYFPIAVWLQNPANAARYKAAGINLYVGLYNGPTSNHLATLQKAGVSVICGQRRGLEYKDNPIIVGWMHGDEPDNAQSLGQGKGYGPPILPEVIVRNYERIRADDPTRPVLLNLGQGVAYDNYIGRGVRRRHLEDYPEYIKGCDIASFDIYPVVHENAEVAGKLEFVAKGVERLRDWSRGEKVVWNCIECTRISNVERKATPEQVRAEVWMSLIHGSRGIIYFVHQFKPAFREAALLDDAEMVSGVTAINKQIQELAPVLAAPPVTNLVTAQSASDVPVATMVKQHNGATYVFAVAMRNKGTKCTFKFASGNKEAKVEVLGESRTLAADDLQFSDEFPPYGVHLYRVTVK
jgi:hypothetical protein